MDPRQIVAPLAGIALACLFAASCGSKGTATTNGTTGTAGAGTTASTSSGTGGGSTSTGTAGGASTSGTGTGGGSTTSTTGSSTSSSSGAPPTTCTTTVTAVDVSSPTAVIGTGTAASCTEAKLAAAIANAGIITFDCGDAAAVIPITTTMVLRTDKDTTLDGGNLVTLDGGDATQIFTFTGPNFQTTKTTVTFQHIRFANAKATGSMPFPPASAPCSQGFQDGGGGVIQIRDGVLHVIDATFDTNHGAVPGPDIAGGGIYAIGSLDVTVVGSTFTGNDASNGGAIGSLFSDLTVINSTFTGNKALGSGANSTNSTCPVVGGQRETGSGGNGGAISIDGGETFTVVMCGDVFSGNVGGTGALGGALFRTPDGAMQETDIDQCTFDGNNADSAGAMYFHNSHLKITSSTLSNNVANGSGAIQADGTILDLTNVTLYGNSAKTNPGGTISLFGNSGTFTNVTFAKNHCDGAPGDGFGVDLFGGTALTINNSLFDSASQMDENAPMACQNTNSGGQDFQWPKTHSMGTNPDNPCVTGIDFADPLLGTLGANGGPTQTALPGAGSPAIGAGKGCPATDQRGNPRPATGCTAGAVEVN
jgi:hypothetical protein